MRSHVSKSVSVFLLSLIVLGLAVEVLPVHADSTAWYNSAWGYRSSFVVSQAAGADVNFQVPVTVINGSGTSTGQTIYINNQTQSDFEDLRVTGSDGTTLYDTWNQTTINGVSCTFWVEVQANLTAANATCFLYWGNAAASAAWNQTATFVDVITGVVGAWNMEETSGTNIRDYSGNNNNGSATNTTIIDSPFFSGKSARQILVKNGDTINLGNPTILNITTSNFTLIMNIKLLAAPSGSNYGFYFGRLGWHIGIIQTSGGISASSWNGTSQKNVNYAFTDTTTPHLIAMKLISGTERLYFDGTEQGTPQTPFTNQNPNTLGNWTIGFKGGSEGVNFVGANAIILNTDVTAVQLTNIKNNYPDVSLEDEKVLVRKYATSTQPAVSSQSSYESYSTAITYVVNNGILWVNSTSVSNGTTINYAYDTTLQFTATPDNNTYSFTSFDLGGNSTTSNPATYGINGVNTKTLTVTFTALEITTEDAAAIAVVFGVMAIGVCCALIVMKRRD